MSTLSKVAAGIVAGVMAGAGLLLASPAAASEPPLVVPVTVAVDDTFRADPEWSQSVARAFAGANERIGAPLRIRFEVERRAAWVPAGQDLDDYLQRLREQVGPRSGGIVVGLTRQRPDPRTVFGATDYVGALTVVSVPSGGLPWDRELAHELGHVFGAIHVPGGDELMAPEGPGRSLDVMNARLMALHRSRRFPPARFPLEGAQLDAAARLYQDAALAAPAGAYRALAAVERARGDLGAALRAAEKLVAVRPDARSIELRARVLADLGPAGAAATASRYGAPSRESRPARVLHQLAVEAARNGRREEAIGMCRRALQLEPDYGPALADLAVLLLQDGMRDEAVNCARRAAALGAPVSPDFQAVLQQPSGGGATASAR